VEAKEIPWAVVFVDAQSLVPENIRGIPLHPTQIYLSLMNLFVFLCGLWMLRKSNRPGLVFAIVGIGYSVLRFIVEFFRGDMDRGMWLNGSFFFFFLSTSQLIAVFWLFICILTIINHKKKLIQKNANTEKNFE